MIITILQSPVPSLKETGSRLALRFKMGHLTPDMLQESRKLTENRRCLFIDFFCSQKVYWDFLSSLALAFSFFI